MAELYEHLQDWKGSPDGANVVHFKKGEQDPLPPALAEVALAEKWVKKAGAKPEKKAPPKSGEGDKGDE